MRLRTFESYWIIKNGLLFSYPSLQNNVQTSVTVVGGGITGALISHALMDAGYKVLLVDKRDIGSGSTSATTSMLQYEIDVPLFKLTEMIGVEGAAACYIAGVNAIKRLERLLSRLKIDCGFESKHSLYIAHNKTSVNDLKEEYAARKACGIKVKWLSASAVKAKYGIECYGAIWSDVAASLDAYQLAHCLIQYNINRGMQVYDQTEVIQHRNYKGKIILGTKTGFKIQSDKVVYCNGYESTKMLKEKIAKLNFTYATVSEQGVKIKPALKNTLIWNTADPYLYMRTTADNRFLVGGEDGPVLTPDKQQTLKDSKGLKLVKKMSQILPEVNFIPDFLWGGIFGTTKDGLPYIGASPEYKNTWFVLGFGGNGITFSIQGMEILIDMLDGKEHKLEKYYRFGR